MFRKPFRSVPAPVVLFAVTAPFVALSMVGTTSAATPSGTCVSARIEAPFRLPDGTLHGAGTLTLCDARSLSPVATIHRTYVDGRPAGMFVSQERRSEVDAGAPPSVVFRRDGDGQLDLLGYVLPAGRRSVTYQLGEHRLAPAPAMTGSAVPVAFVVAAVK